MCFSCSSRKIRVTGEVCNRLSWCCTCELPLVELLWLLWLLLLLLWLLLWPLLLLLLLPVLLTGFGVSDCMRGRDGRAARPLTGGEGLVPEAGDEAEEEEEEGVEDVLLLSSTWVGCAACTGRD